MTKKDNAEKLVVKEKMTNLKKTPVGLSRERSLTSEKRKPHHRRRKDVRGKGDLERTELGALSQGRVSSRGNKEWAKVEGKRGASERRRR